MVYCHIHCLFFAVDKPKFIHTNICMHTYTPLQNNTMKKINNLKLARDDNITNNLPNYSKSWKRTCESF